MSKITYKTRKAGRAVSITVLNDGNEVDTFDVPADTAEGLATSILDALKDGPDEQMIAELREAMNGVRVKISEDAYALFTEEYEKERDEVYFDAGTEATIIGWDDYESEMGFDSPFDRDANFPVQDDDGMIQVVALDCCEPVDREVVAEKSLEVGARWAEARGIVPGADVLLPPTSLVGLIFGTGEVKSVDGGVASVYIEAADVTEKFAVTSLFAA